MVSHEDEIEAIRAKILKDEAQLAFGRDFKKNGSVAALTVATPSK